MAQTVEEILGDAISGGVVVTKYQHALSLLKIKIIEAGHPIPDMNSLSATREMIQLVSDLTGNDIVLFVLSGGASSLFADCPGNLRLAEIQALYELLLKSGADIFEMNTVRKHLSKLKGGQLAKLVYPARLYSFILSDVIGDEMDVIGSGPTVPDKSTFEDAWNVLTKYNVINKVTHPILQYLKDGIEGKIPETPKDGDRCFDFTSNIIIGNNWIALKAAAAKAKELGYHDLIVTDRLQGEASLLGKTLSKKAIDYKGPRPACLLYGGESTVTVNGKGLGGRNMELALSAAIEIRSHTNITVLAAGTDGTDGPTDAAGAVADCTLINQALNNDYDPTEYLKNNDSYNFFSPFDALIKTGPTQTNVMDIVLTLIH